MNITDIDFIVLDFIRDHFRCDFLDMAMPKITALGNKGFVWISAAAAMLVFPKYRKDGIKLGVSLGAGALIGNAALKNLVERARPCWIKPVEDMLISMPHDYSFPSGHTLSSFAAATVIMKANRKMGIAAYILASLIGFSRLYLYVHFPTDVLAGAVIGVLIGLCTCRIWDKYLER